MHKEKWFQYPFRFQLGNIGSEISQIRKRGEEGDDSNKVIAYERAFELLDLTIQDPKNHNRLRELLRFRECLGCLYVDSSEILVPLSYLEKYCAEFALAG